MQSVTNNLPLPTGNPSTTGLNPDAASVIATYLSNPVEVENMRRAVRSWFCAYLPIFEQQFGPFDLEGSVHAYEALDELLSGLIYQPVNGTGK